MRCDRFSFHKLKSTALVWSKVSSLACNTFFFFSKNIHLMSSASQFHLTLHLHNFIMLFIKKKKKENKKKEPSLYMQTTPNDSQ